MTLPLPDIAARRGLLLITNVPAPIVMYGAVALIVPLLI